MRSDQTATVVVAAVILYEGKVLIQERSEDLLLPGRWECPGGAVHCGEGLEAAIKREILEELAWDVDVHRLLHTQINTYGTGVNYLVLFYHCTLCTTTSLIGAHIRFVKPEELAAYNPLPGTIEAVSRLGDVTGERFSFVQNYPEVQTLEETLMVLTYELGKVIEYYHKAKRYGESAYYSDANQKKEMSDLISMCRMYCEQRGWNFEELMKFGEECYLERMTDLKKYGKEA